MRKIIIANWKMNPASPQEARRLFNSVQKITRKLRGAEVVIMPPFVYLPLFNPSRAIKLGAQDVSFKSFPAGAGAYTGEISARMLKMLGVSYVLMGHSERREYFGETDKIIGEKLNAAVSQGLKAVLCVGEKEKVKEAFPQIVKSELKAALTNLPRRYAARIIIAYEPVWAISTTKGAKPDTPGNFFEMSIFIRRVILDIWGKAAALKIPILYGGSVTSKNAKGFLEVNGTQGLLVGGASLRAEEFSKILDFAKRS
ncbi:MAG: triose-phosphate isomerase [bacterium]|nr:triose-phosphate isomerase [bacterium]